MKRETFIKQIKNGEITDFSKYLAIENRQIWYRVEMAKLGVCVEELAQMGGTTCTGRTCRTWLCQAILSTMGS